MRLSSAKGRSVLDLGGTRLYTHRLEGEAREEVGMLTKHNTQAERTMLPSKGGP